MQPGPKAHVFDQSTVLGLKMRASLKALLIVPLSLFICSVSFLNEEVSQ